MNKRSFRCALITGASMGLGRALARECAARKMTLVLAALPGSGLPELGEELDRESGVPVACLEGDLTESSGMSALLSFVESLELKPDLLVNNAGIGSVGLFEDCDPDYLEATIRLNALALVRLTRSFLSWTKGGAAAQVVNVASLGAFFPMPSLALYSATKSLVLELSFALREELRGRTGVTALCPNAIRTNKTVGEYVDRFGLLARLACQSPEFVASAAIDGAERDRALVVPGRFNRALLAVGRALPRALVMKAIRRCWGGFEASCEEA